MTCEAHSNLCQTIRPSCLYLKYLSEKVLQEDNLIPLDHHNAAKEMAILIANIELGREKAL